VVYGLRQQGEGRLANRTANAVDANLCQNTIAYDSLDGYLIAAEGVDLCSLDVRVVQGLAVARVPGMVKNHLLLRPSYSPPAYRSRTGGYRSLVWRLAHT
jgi:hypothetical protein